jgi:phage recombination protein Bet
VDAPPLITVEHLALVRATIAKDATPEELDLFVYDCQRRGVHPLDRLLHFTKRGGRYTPVTSIDFMRSRAAATGACAGIDDAVFVGAPASGDFAATVIVWRLVQGERCPFTATARWDEYRPESNAFMWTRMPHQMLGKCAEAAALRKGFPQELAGLYEVAELDQAARPGDTAPLSALANPVELPPQRRSTTNGRSTISDAQVKRLWVIARNAGWHEDEVRAHLKKYGYEHTAEILKDQYEQICSELEHGVDGGR